LPNQYFRMNQSYSQQQQQLQQTLSTSAANKLHASTPNGSSQLTVNNAAVAAVSTSGGSANNNNLNNVVGIANKLRPLNVNLCHLCMRPLSLQSLSGTINSPSGNLIVVSEFRYYFYTFNFSIYSFYSSKLIYKLTYINK
jgi:hypothetical protein